MAANDFLVAFQSIYQAVPLYRKFYRRTGRMSREAQNFVILYQKHLSMTQRFIHCGGLHLESGGDTMPTYRTRAFLCQQKRPCFYVSAGRKPKVLTFLFFFSFSACGRQEIRLLPFLFGWQCPVVSCQIHIIQSLPLLEEGLDCAAAYRYDSVTAATDCGGGARAPHHGGANSGRSHCRGGRGAWNRGKRFR